MHLRAAADCLCRSVLGHRRHGIQRCAGETGRTAGWPNQFSFENFIFAWMDIGVWQYLLNSILVVFFGTVLQVSVSALAAYALARKKFRGVALVSW